MAIKILGFSPVHNGILTGAMPLVVFEVRLGIDLMLTEWALEDLRLPSAACLSASKSSMSVSKISSPRPLTSAFPPLFPRFWRATPIQAKKQSHLLLNILNARITLHHQWHRNRWKMPKLKKKQTEARIEHNNVVRKALISSSWNLSKLKNALKKTGNLKHISASNVIAVNGPSST